MFDDTDSEVVDLTEKPRQSLIPDPEGDEMRKIAKVHGFTAVSITFKHRETEQRCGVEENVRRALFA